MKSPFSHLITISALCVIAFIGYGVLYAALSSKSASVAALENSIATKTETVKRIAATRATLAGIATDETVIQNYFVPETGVVTFIDALESHGREQSAVVNVLSVSKSGTTEQPTLALSTTIKGTFDAVMRTTGAIEFMPYNLLVTSLTVSQDAKDVWHADVKLLVGSVPAVTLTKIL